MLHRPVRREKRVKDVEDVVVLIVVSCCVREHLDLARSGLAKRAVSPYAQFDDAVVRWVIHDTEAIVHQHYFMLALIDRDCFFDTLTLLVVPRSVVVGDFLFWSDIL